MKIRLFVIFAVLLALTVSSVAQAQDEKILVIGHAVLRWFFWNESGRI